jgi:wobble nucleotide-excising tRNase
MIIQINKIKNITVFKDHKWASTCPEFRKFNAFYGWNASGKTTLTRIFSAFERGSLGNLEMADDSECVLITDDNNRLSLKSNQIPDLFKNKIRVFNEDFVKENLNWEKGEASKIIMLGKNQIEQKKELRQILRELDENQKKLEVKKNENQKKENDKQKFLRNIRDEIIENLRSVDDISPKSNRARDYKDYTVNDVEKIMNEIEEPSSFSDDKIQYFRNSLIEKESKSIIHERIIDMTWVDILINQIEQISKIPIFEEGLKFLELQVDEEVKEWLRIGYEIHKDKKPPLICEFCKNIISEERLKEIAEYFNEVLRNLFRDIDQVIESLSQDKLPNIGLQKEQFYSEFQNNFLELNNNFNSALNTIRKELNNLKETLEEKKKKPSNKIAINYSNVNNSKTELENIIVKINELIQKNNEKTNSFKNTRQESAHNLEEAIIIKKKSEYDAIEREINEIQKDIESVSNEISRLTENENKLEQKLKQHHFAAAEFNKLLKSFMGRSEIVLETVDEGYIIRRDKKIACNLSEGERNAIAFIFSLIKLKEENFDAENGIIVIDDPVSSFDSQFIYSAFGFIKEKIKEINPNQVFIFTHNFPFFRLVRDWMKHEKNKKNNYSFYMIKSKIIGDRRNSIIEKLDKLLVEHNSEYIYLFKLVFNRYQSPDSDLEKDYIFPNVIRKLLENYLSFKVPLGGVKIHEKLSKLCNEDYPNKISLESKSRLESFCQDQSHPLYQDSPTDFDERLIGEIQAICKAIIELIQKSDEKHFKHLLDECGLTN